jgi:hypothetical protein
VCFLKKIRNKNFIEFLLEEKRMFYTSHCLKILHYKLSREEDPEAKQLLRIIQSPLTIFFKKIVCDEEKDMPTRVDALRALFDINSEEFLTLALAMLVQICSRQEPGQPEVERAVIVPTIKDMVRNLADVNEDQWLNVRKSLYAFLDYSDELDPEVIKEIEDLWFTTSLGYKKNGRLFFDIKDFKESSG